MAARQRRSCYHAGDPSTGYLSEGCRFSLGELLFDEVGDPICIGFHLFQFDMLCTVDPPLPLLVLAPNESMAE